MDAETQKRIDIVDKFVHQLAEHFDAVQINVSFVLPDGHTQRISRGSGNWYARKGMTQEFLEQDQACTMAHELGKIRSKDQ